MQYELLSTFDPGGQRDSRRIRTYIHLNSQCRARKEPNPSELIADHWRNLGSGHFLRGNIKKVHSTGFRFWNFHSGKDLLSRGTIDKAAFMHQTQLSCWWLLHLQWPQEFYSTWQSTPRQHVPWESDRPLADQQRQRKKLPSPTSSQLQPRLASWWMKTEIKPKVTR